MDVRCIVPVMGRGAQQTTTNIIAKSPELLVTGHTETPSRNLSVDQMDLGTSDLVAATFE